MYVYQLIINKNLSIHNVINKYLNVLKYMYVHEYIHVHIFLYFL